MAKPGFVANLPSKEADAVLAIVIPDRPFSRLRPEILSTQWSVDTDTAVMLYV
jgi:hypothetical protein